MWLPRVPCRLRLPTLNPTCPAIPRCTRCRASPDTWAATTGARVSSACYFFLESVRLPPSTSPSASSSSQLWANLSNGLAPSACTSRSRGLFGAGDTARRATTASAGPLFEGEMIVFAGRFLAVAFCFVLTNRRSRKLSENAEDLRGSARWAREDIWATGLLSSRKVFMSADGGRTTALEFTTGFDRCRR